MTPGRAAAFQPYETLAARLLATLDHAGGDGAHDEAHILRVWSNARAIAQTEPACDLELLAAAVILHDCVAVEKDDPRRAQASRLAADRAEAIVRSLGCLTDRLPELRHAIEAHSFSANIAPQTLEARILQDADRLDAIGAIGIARCFYSAGRMGSALYDPADPLAQRRALDDRRFALDHFEAKLFHLVEGFHTRAGKAIADARVQFMRSFVEQFRGEIG